MSNLPSVLLVGAGPMAVEYAKILRAKNIAPITIGRSDQSAQKFQSETGFVAETGGLDEWLERNPTAYPSHAVVAVGEKTIGGATLALLEHGFKSILVEKPGGFDAEDIRAVGAKAEALGSAVSVGYNRRFFASSVAAKQIIAEDGGVLSFNFEFTEWGHVISGLVKEEGVKEQWFLSNSTHVIDLAFHLGGMPSEFSAFVAGSLNWHPEASVFSGAGKAENGALFSYQANWAAPGRWGVEILTRKHRLILRPMERLQIQKIGSVAIEFVDIDDHLDKDFKPGLYKQAEAFFAGDNTVLPSIRQQVAALDVYLKIRSGSR
jgi:predicted dehydrogenase